MSRIYESGQYYHKVKESTNGLEREYLEEEKWKRGDDRLEENYFNRERERDLSSSSSHRNRSRFSHSPSSRNGERRPFCDDHDFDQSFSKSRGFRHDTRMTSDRFDRAHSIPTDYRDNPPPVYSIVNSRPSDYNSRNSHQDERLSQSEIGRSRPGSPQVVAGPGEIINTEHGFTIELDVRHFRPQDIKVSLTGNTLTVYGERLEDDPHSTQTLRRSFTRKYSIPNDVRMSSISSFMTDSGLLILKGSRKGWKETEISVHVAPPEHRTASSVISIV